MNSKKKENGPLKREKGRKNEREKKRKGKERLSTPAVPY